LIRLIARTLSLSLLPFYYYYTYCLDSGKEMNIIERRLFYHSLYVIQVSSDFICKLVRFFFFIHLSGWINNGLTKIRNRFLLKKAPFERWLHTVHLIIFQPQYDILLCKRGILVSCHESIVYGSRLRAVTIFCTYIVLFQLRRVVLSDHLMRYNWYLWLRPVWH